MAAEIITKADLQEFGENLLSRMKTLFGGQLQSKKNILKSAQLRNLLKISDNTLRILRHNGTIPFAKIGEIHY